MIEATEIIDQEIESLPGGTKTYLRGTRNVFRETRPAATSWLPISPRTMIVLMGSTLVGALVAKFVIEHLGINGFSFYIFQNLFTNFFYSQIR